MKYLKCPQCQVMAPAKHYKGGKLRCYDCSTPGHPVFVEVIERPERKKSA